MAYSGNWSGLTNMKCRPILNLIDNLPNLIEPTILKDLHRYLLRRQFWNHGLIQ